MRLVWTRPASAQLRAIGRHVAADDPQAALRLVRRIRSAVDLLADRPQIGRPGREPGTRELVVSGTSYIVPYIVRSARVEVLAVFHTSRKWPDDLD
jgi:toxin ParE1/3/4